MITWNAVYSVKIDLIDGQHQELVKIINALEVAMRAGEGKETLEQTLSGLIQYTQEHFQTEERLMETHGFPGLAYHRTEHAALTHQVLELQRKYYINKVGLTVTTANFLSEWLTLHILGQDKKYGFFLKAKGLV